MAAQDDWQPITAEAPAQGDVVLTRISDAYGTRNMQRLYRQGRLWFLEDGSMYVYYEPTEFMPHRMVPIVGAIDATGGGGDCGEGAGR